MLYKKRICFQIHDFISKDIEGIVFDILLPKTKPITVGIFYRPPDQYDFLEVLTNNLESIGYLNKEIILLGDFNINLLKNGKYIFENESNQSDNSQTTLFKNYKEFCNNFSLKQLIKEVTRIVCNSPDYLLYHILTNSPQNVSQFGIIDLALSDHQMIYLTRKINHEKFLTHKQVTFRCLKNYSANKFKDLLNSVVFPNYENFNNVDEAYTNFHSKLLKIIEQIAPLKISRMKNKTPEWFDTEIFEKIKFKRKKFKKFKKSKSLIDNDLYIEARNDANRTIKRKKESFVKRKLENNINEPKALWKTIKSLGLPNKTTSTAKICLKVKEGICFEPKGISDIFKDYYSNLAENLVSKLPPAPKIYGTSSTKLYYDQFNINASSFSFTECKDSQIKKILQVLDIAKAVCIDSLNSRFLTEGTDALCVPLRQICNLSLKLATFPKECKIAKLKPLFKKGSSTDAKNYRPISLLPQISKILEKVVLEKTQVYLKENNLIYELQSGFRDQHSTNMCLSYLIDKILSGFDSGLLTGMILIDLQKAFDTIDHNILLKK